MAKKKRWKLSEHNLRFCSNSLLKPEIGTEQKKKYKGNSALRILMALQTRKFKLEMMWDVYRIQSWLEPLVFCQKVEG